MCFEKICIVKRHTSKIAILVLRIEIKLVAESVQIKKSAAFF